MFSFLRTIPLECYGRIPEVVSNKRMYSKEHKFSWLANIQDVQNSCQSQGCTGTPQRNVTKGRLGDTVLHLCPKCVLNLFM